MFERLIKLHTITLVNIGIFIFGMNHLNKIQIISLILVVKALSFHIQVLSERAHSRAVIDRENTGKIWLRFFIRVQIKVG
jgi:hypothetical protein